MSFQASRFCSRVKGRALLLSPHLDDAVFSAGGLLSTRTDIHVITIFAGIPRDAHLLTGWDRQCGFSSSRTAVRARRKEDRKSLLRLGLRFRHLNALDWQYRSAHYHCVPQFAAEASEEIYAPLGLMHVDHEIVRQYAISEKKRRDKLVCHLYADLPYAAAIAQETLQRWCVRLGHANGVKLLPVPLPLDEATMLTKIEASRCYRSQLAGFAALGLRLSNAQALYKPLRTFGDNIQLERTVGSNLLEVLQSHAETVARFHKVQSRYAEIRWLVQVERQARKKTVGQRSSS